MTKINIDIEKIKKSLSSNLMNLPKHDAIEDRVKWLISEMEKRKKKNDK